MRFIVIGITDNPEPFFPPEVLEIIRNGKVFSGGRRHHEIVAPLLPADAQWIDITVPLDAVFEQYQSQTSNLKSHKSLPGFITSASSKVRMALQSVAARFEPPFLPSTIILGISLKGFTMCFDSLTCTKPTGAAMIPAG